LAEREGDQDGREELLKELGGEQGGHGIDQEAGEHETKEISRFYTRRGRVAGGGKEGRS